MDEKINKIIAIRNKLNEWINSDDEEIKHDFIMRTGDMQLWYKGKLDALDEIINILK
jgi:hypothetical protein